MERPATRTGVFAFLAMLLAIATATASGCGVRSPLDDGPLDGSVSGDGGPCGTGTTSCNGTCTVTDFDPSNCGGCGIKCGVAQSCVKGLCTSSECNGGSTKCVDRKSVV